MVEIIGQMSKQEQYQFFQNIRHLIPLSQSEIARLADVSSALVSAVFNGINTNPKVIQIIELNIEDGWESFVPSKLAS
jgi:transcriptional regulator with XRE-family HTH domain